VPRLRRLTQCVLCGLFLTAFSRPTPAAELHLLVDATELPRKLLRSKLTVGLPESRALVYPRWWPGHHGPVGAIQNIAGLTVSDQNSSTVSWERDWADVYRFVIGHKPIRDPVDVGITYVCNQPTDNTIGCDSYGYPALGVINWNTVILYPEGVPVRDIQVRPRLILPEGWRYGTALKLERTAGDTLVFQSVSLETLIDMPLICGEHFSAVKYASTDQADYFLHIAADDPDFMPRNDSTRVALKRLAEEAEAVFGRTHFDEYHFLLTVSDFVPHIGLEHRNSSLNSVKADAFRDPEKHDNFLRSVLPHEFVHAWCGKYRRPAGMNTEDYQVEKNMDLLWVYEGLAQYLGEVLMTRAGLVTMEDYLGEQAFIWGYYQGQEGRRWRPLRDTQVASYTIREWSKAWGLLRRNQDYYDEGALIWLEFDARIRNATKGERSLDEFCAAIFGKGDPKLHAISFDLDEIISGLSELADEPWADLIEERTAKTEGELNVEGLRLAGYRFGVTDEKPDMEKIWWSAFFDSEFHHRSIGLAADKEGVISEVVPGGPADAAGLYDGVKIIGVNGKTFSYDRLEDAVRNTASTGKVTLLSLQADTYRDYVINYDGGLRFDKLVRIDGTRDWLTEILKPKRREARR
jgi:predicted metalloprotease with PDZ domain